MSEKIVSPSKFPPPDKKVKFRSVTQLEIVYFDDGEIWSQLTEQVGKKWSHCSTCYGEKSPSCELLHKCPYIGKDDKCFQPPHPISALIARMKYIAHCFSIGKLP